MALIKENNEFGIVADYWRVINISVDITTKTALVFVGLYTKKEVERFLETRTITVYGEDFDKYFSKDNILNFNDVYEASYMCVKEHSDYFKDAEDDEEEILKTL